MTSDMHPLTENSSPDVKGSLKHWQAVTILILPCLLCFGQVSGFDFVEYDDLQHLVA
ncbi:MAG: hypothetical protein ACI9HK_003747, partial [Pirellulaceae bacterium]